MWPPKRTKVHSNLVLVLFSVIACVRVLQSYHKPHQLWINTFWLLIDHGNDSSREYDGSKSDMDQWNIISTWYCMATQSLSAGFPTLQSFWHDIAEIQRGKMLGLPLQVSPFLKSNSIDPCCPQRRNYCDTVHDPMHNAKRKAPSKVLYKAMYNDTISTRPHTPQAIKSKFKDRKRLAVSTSCKHLKRQEPIM